jgi:hypothetical protein
MTFVALVDSFAAQEEMPILIDSVIGWIRARTDHKIINLHPVHRDKKAFRGACRRTAIPSVGAPPYSQEYDIITEILFGNDLPEEWKRLVICKELLHVFDPPGEQVRTSESVKTLIMSVIAPEIKGAPFLPAMNDHLGAFRAMTILMPRATRLKIQPAYESGARSISEISSFVRLPEHYVDIWIRHGEQFESFLCGRPFTQGGAADNRPTAARQAAPSSPQPL